jgi:hypothetical protein
MPDQPPHDFAYVHTDIPEGMTIRDWRAQRAGERAAQQQAEREARRQRSVPRRIRSATGEPRPFMRTLKRIVAV